MNNLPFQQSSSNGAPAFGFNRHGFGVLDKFGRDPVGLHAKKYPALLACNGGPIGIAKPGSRFYKGVENGLQIEGRAADDLEHIGSGGLLLQRLPQPLEQPRILGGDDDLAGANGVQGG